MVQKLGSSTQIPERLDLLLEIPRDRLNFPHRSWRGPRSSGEPDTQLHLPAIPQDGIELASEAPNTRAKPVSLWSCVRGQSTALHRCSLTMKPMAAPEILAAPLWVSALMPKRDGPDVECAVHVAWLRLQQGRLLPSLLEV